MKLLLAAAALLFCAAGAGAAELPVPAAKAPVAPLAGGIPKPLVSDRAALLDPAAGLSVPQTVPAQTFEDGQVVFPEVNTRAIFSATGLNRIVCPAGPIPRIPSRSDKEVVVQYFGNSAFVTFPVPVEGGRVATPSRPVELFLPCGDAIYHVSGYVRDVPGQVIRLGSGKAEEIRDNLELFKGMPFEKKLRLLVKAAYTGEIPPSYRVSSGGQAPHPFRDLELRRVKSVAAVGTGLSVTEYRGRPVAGIAYYEVRERDFCRREFGKRIATVAVDGQNLHAGEEARIFVVTMEDDDESAR